jgi:hypothetical protein
MLLFMSRKVAHLRSAEVKFLGEFFTRIPLHPERVYSPGFWWINKLLMESLNVATRMLEASSSSEQTDRRAFY